MPFDQPTERSSSLILILCHSHECGSVQIRRVLIHLPKVRPPPPDSSSIASIAFLAQLIHSPSSGFHFLRLPSSSALFFRRTFFFSDSLTLSPVCPAPRIHFLLSQLRRSDGLSSALVSLLPIRFSYKSTGHRQPKHHFQLIRILSSNKKSTFRLFVLINFSDFASSVFTLHFQFGNSSRLADFETPQLLNQQFKNAFLHFDHLLLCRIDCVDSAQLGSRCRTLQACPNGSQNHQTAAEGQQARQTVVGTSDSVAIAAASATAASNSVSPSAQFCSLSLSFNFASNDCNLFSSFSEQNRKKTAVRFPVFVFPVIIGRSG